MPLNPQNNSLYFSLLSQTAGSIQSYFLFWIHASGFIICYAQVNLSTFCFKHSKEHYEKGKSKKIFIGGILILKEMRKHIGLEFPCG